MVGGLLIEDHHIDCYKLIIKVLGLTRSVSRMVGIYSLIIDIITQTVINSS